MPDNVTDLAVLRIVVRKGFSADMAGKLLGNRAETVACLDEPGASPEDILPTTGEPANTGWVNAGTLLGAIAFFSAALILLRSVGRGAPTRAGHQAAGAFGRSG